MEVKIFDSVALKTAIPEATLISLSKENNSIIIRLAYPITQFEEKVRFRPRAETDRFTFLSKEFDKIKQLKNQYYSLVIYDDVAHAARHIAYEITRSIVSKQRFFTHTDVDVNLTNNGSVLNITVHRDDIKNNTEFSNLILQNIKCEFEKSETLSEAVKQINITVGRSPNIYDFPQFVQYDDEEYYEDDTPPNWPSKTGNPSGGGRDNNPPKS